MKAKHVQLEDMVNIIEKCFYILKTNKMISEDQEASVALKLLESCYKDLILTVSSMGEALGKIEGVRDNESEPFRLRKRSQSDSKSN